MHTQIDLVPWIAAFFAAIVFALLFRAIFLRSQRVERFNINDAVAQHRTESMSPYTGSYVSDDVIKSQHAQMQGEGLKKYLESLS
jgi:hypothetical protein